MSICKKIFTEKNLRLLLIILVIIQPVIDMDYLFYSFLDAYGLPRFSTIVRFLIIPGLVLWTWLAQEKNKKKVFWIALAYGICFFVYFFLHCRQCQQLFPRLALTDNFRFSTWQELTYVLTLVLPYGLTYCFYHQHFQAAELKRMVMATSGVISIPDCDRRSVRLWQEHLLRQYRRQSLHLVLRHLRKWYHPRTLASKFFFNEGNTIGILLFMILPLLYYFFSISETKKEQRRRLYPDRDAELQCRFWQPGWRPMAPCCSGLFLVLYAAGCIFSFIRQRWQGTL
jgi:hypothetical protein